MKRAEPPSKVRWKAPLAFVSVVLVGLAALLVGVAIYSYDLGDVDEIDGLSDLNDGVRALVTNERKGGAGAQAHRHVMELQGTWNGMTLKGPDEPKAQMGAAPGTMMTPGAMIAAIDPQAGRRARECGLTEGDVIVGVDQQPVTGLADLRVVTAAVDAREPLMIDVRRRGQLHTLVLPPEPPPTQIGLPAALAGPSLFCPRDGILVPAARAGNGICPICGGPLHQYTPNVQGGVR